MAKQTVLEMTQDVLRALKSDQVNSINDTEESLRVAHLLKSKYYEIIPQLTIPEHNTLFELTASGDNNLPTLMTLPANVARIDKLKYDNKETGDTNSKYENVEYMNLDRFIDRQGMLANDTSGNVGEMEITLEGDTHKIMYRDDKFPQYWTTPDDHTLLFDSFDSDEESTLVADRTMAIGSVYPTFTVSDGHTPDLDEDLFPLLLNETISTAFTYLKEMENSKAEQGARRGWITAQRVKRTVPYPRGPLSRLPNYGRKQ